MAVTASALALSGCSICDRQTLSEVRSPDERHIARVLEKNCGATVEYLTEVTMQRSSWFADPVRLIQVRSVDVQLIWVNSSLLIVRCLSCSGEVRGAVNQWDGVRIEFQKF